MSEIEDELPRQAPAERAQSQTVPEMIASLPPPGVQDAAPPRVPPAIPPLPATIPAAKSKGAQRKGLAGALTAIGAVIAKFWAVIVSLLLKLKGLLVAFKLLTFGKVLLTGGSM